MAYLPFLVNQRTAAGLTAINKARAWFTEDDTFRLFTIRAQLSAAFLADCCDSVSAVFRN